MKSFAKGEAGPYLPIFAQPYFIGGYLFPVLFRFIIFLFLFIIWTDGVFNGLAFLETFGAILIFRFLKGKRPLTVRQCSLFRLFLPFSFPSLRFPFSLKRREGKRGRAKTIFTSLPFFPAILYLLSGKEVKAERWKTGKEKPS